MVQFRDQGVPFRRDEVVSVNWLNRIHVGDTQALLRRMVDDGVRAQMCVCSPPFWGLRDYGVKGQIGQEKTLAGFIHRLANVFDTVKEVLEPNGTLWIEMGDAMVSSGGTGNQGKRGARNQRRHTQRRLLRHTGLGLKPKNMMGQPWRLAFALQDRGWILRQEIIWDHANPMPESVKDRPSTQHSRIFLFAKQRYYKYNAAAIAEPCSPNTHLRVSQDVAKQNGSRRANGGTRPDRPMKAFVPVSGWMSGPGSHKAKDHAVSKSSDGTKFGRPPRVKTANMDGALNGEHPTGMRNSRTIWRIPSEAFHGAHFACFPREVPRRCILAGSDPGDIILDPFMGSGTTAEVASALGRQFIGTELSAAYVKLAYQHRNFQVGIPMPIQSSRRA